MPPLLAPARPNAVRVLVCDDSAVARAVLTRALEQDTTIQVVAHAGNGVQAMEAVQRRGRGAIDLVVLDIEMPVMDGLTALPELLRLDPSLRILVASALTTRGADMALRALRLGASDTIPKPGTDRLRDSNDFARELIAKVKGLTTRGLVPISRAAPPPSTPAPRAAPARRPLLLAIGSSTGGPQALFVLTAALGRLNLPVVLTQHMPPSFTASLAEHITRLGTMPCREARDGDLLQAGEIVLAPGGRHLEVNRAENGLRARLTDAQPENFCRPSVDPMLRSAATACNGRVLVVMLTGMGQDGLAGTSAVIAAGGTAIAQDEATSVVWGMPGAIAQAGLCHAILPLPRIAAAVRALTGP